MLEIFQWASWLSVHKYSTEILMANEFHGLNFTCPPPTLGKGTSSVPHPPQVGEIHVPLPPPQVRELHMPPPTIAKELHVPPNHVR